MVVRIVLGFILVFLADALPAQELLAEGRVVHSQTRKPVQGARVLEKGSLNAVISRADGSYSLPVSARPLQLVVSHPKFKTRLIYQEADSLLVLLEPLDLQYHAPVKDDEVESFDKLASRVREFRFYDQLIFILGNSGQEVRMIEKDGSLVERTLTPVKMDGLYQDCLGNLYAYNRDSAYQVFYDYADIRFIEPLPFKEFEEYVLPCRCYFQGGLIFSISRRRDLITAVKYANKKGIVATLKEFADSNALSLLDENYTREYFTNRGLQGYEAQVFMGDLSEEELSEKQEEARLSWLDAYSIRPNKVFAFAEANHFSLYDLKEMKQYFYTSISGQPEVSKLKMPVKDATSMLRDDVTDRLYVLYVIKSRVKLKPVISSGQEITIDEFPFPKNARIHNEDVYFISNPALDGGNYLFRRN